MSQLLSIDGYEGGNSHAWEQSKYKPHVAMITRTKIMCLSKTKSRSSS